MKNIKTYLPVLLFVVSVIGFTGCKKTDSDREAIEQYATDNGLNGQFTSSGLYYVIYKEGNDQHPGPTSDVKVKYKGYYLSGEVFDSNDKITFNLSQLIRGWQEGLPLIGEGGEITLLIPSALAYNDGVRAFDITLFSTLSK